MTGYGKGVVCEDGWELVGEHGTIQPGDRFLPAVDGEWMDCENTVGLPIQDTPFVAVSRKIKELSE